MTTPGGETIIYAYDADGALTGVTDWEDGLYAFTYGEDGAMLSARSPNGVTARFDYSPLGLPSAVHLGRDGEDAPIARITLSFDGRDALVEAADSALGRSRYAYDPDGRLAEVSGAAPERFEYDASRQPRPPRPRRVGVRRRQPPGQRRGHGCPPRRRRQPARR